MTTTASQKPKPASPQLFEIEAFHYKLVEQPSGHESFHEVYLPPDEAIELLEDVLEPFPVEGSSIFHSLAHGHDGMGIGFVWLIVAMDGCYDIAEELVAARECKEDINYMPYFTWTGPDHRSALPPVSIFCIRSPGVLEAAAAKCAILDDIRRHVAGADENLHWLLFYRPSPGTPFWPMDQPEL